MALHRIVLTSPWKLGLFVFMLVVGCGFGLIYAYLSLFGAALDLQDEQVLRTFFAMCGGVALLAILGYLSVVSQARPLERVMRGGQKRARLMRQFGEIEDPRSVDPSDFDEEPDLVAVLERWTQDCGVANNAQMAVVNQREVLTDLAVRLQSATQSPEGLVATDDEMQPLVDAINELIQEARHQSVEPPAETDEEMKQAWHRGLADLQEQQGQLLGFATSVAASSEELSRRAQTDLASGDAHEFGATLRDGSLRNICAKNFERTTELRTTLEALAEEANRQAINAALQVSRLGESGADLVAVTEEIRSLSTRYQRLAADLRICENDQQVALGQIEALALRSRAGDGEGQNSAGLSSASIQKVAMVLDQNAGGLKEIASQLGIRLEDLRQAMGDTSGPPLQATPPPPLGAPEISGPMAAASGPVAPASGPLTAASGPVAPVSGPVAPVSGPVAPVSGPVAAVSGPVDPMQSGRFDIPDPEQSGGVVHDLRQLGAVELPPLSDDHGQPIIDLRELGAVEL